MTIPFDGTSSWGLRLRSSELCPLPTTLNRAIYDSTPIATMRSTRSSTSCKKRLSRKTYILVSFFLIRYVLLVRTTSTTTRSPINLALGISKILTLRLALRLFGKSSNNGSAVYIVLVCETQWIAARPPHGRGSRGEGECYIWSKMSESTL